MFCGRASCKTLISFVCRSLLIEITLLFFAHTSLVHAVPHKVTTIKDSSFFRSDLGFSIHAKGTKWFQTAVPAESKNILSIYRSTWLYEGLPATLTVRVDPLGPEDISLKKYSEKWLKDYPKFGYQILSTSKVTHQDVEGRTLEIVNRKTHRQTRQTVFFLKNVAVIFSCQNHEDDFARSLPACDQLIENVQFQ